LRRVGSGTQGTPVLGVIRDKFQNITCLRLTGSDWKPDELDAIARIWQGTVTSRIKTLYIRLFDPPREMEPTLHAIKASHPQLCHFTIVAWRSCDVDALGSLVRKFPWLQIECTRGVFSRLPRTLHRDSNRI
jgi:hypothetical protein